MRIVPRAEFGRAVLAAFPLMRPYVPSQEEEEDWAETMRLIDERHGEPLEPVSDEVAAAFLDLTRAALSGIP